MIFEEQKKSKKEVQTKSESKGQSVLVEIKPKGQKRAGSSFGNGCIPTGGGHPQKLPTGQ